MVNSRTRISPLFGSCLVPELGLELVPELRQLAVGRKLGCQGGEDLFVCDAEHHVRALAVLQPEHHVTMMRQPAAPFPDLGRVHGRQQELLPPDRVHLLRG